MLGTTIAGIFYRVITMSGYANKIIGTRFKFAVSTLLPALALMATQSAHGALLGVVPQYPDITTSSTDINYVWTPGTGGTMTINGTAASNLASQTIKFFSGDTAHSVCPSNTLNSACNAATLTAYTLTATFDVNGSFSSGTLTVGGYVDGNTGTSGYQPYAGLANSGTLLTANLTAFGFNGSAGTSTYDNLLLDFAGVRTGGDFNALAPGSLIGLKWSGRVNTAGAATYAGSWDAQATPFKKSFSCTGASGCVSSLDTFVPLPAAVWLMGSGLAGLLGAAGRRRRTMAISAN